MAHATATATQGRHRRLPASGMTLVAAIVAFLSATAPEDVGAASSALRAGKAMPATGTTETSFTLSVGYINPQGLRATDVVARVADRTVEMTLYSGRADDGVWEGSTRLPAGSWPVTFQATASQGESPTLAGPIVVVSSGSEVGPEVAPFIAPPSASAAPHAAVAVTPRVDRTPGPRAEGLTGGLPGTLVLVGAAGLGAVVSGSRRYAVARRRRRERASGNASATPPARPVPAARPARKRADWELASLDDEPIGTVDYLGQRP